MQPNWTSIFKWLSCFVSTYLYSAFDRMLLHVTCAFQSESTLYNESVLYKWLWVQIPLLSLIVLFKLDMFYVLYGVSKVEYVRFDVMYISKQNLKNYLLENLFNWLKRIIKINSLNQNNQFIIFFSDSALTSTCDKTFENGPSKICRRQPLKNLNWYGLLRQTIIISNFLKTVFHKFYLVHFLILCLIF